MLTFHVPAPSSMLTINLLGVLGLLGLVVSIGGLTQNWWWSGLVGGVICIALSIVAATHAAVENGDTPQSRPRAVA